MDFKIDGPLLKQSSVCVPILRTLPDWLGIEEAILEYKHEIEHLPTFLAQADVSVLGFLSLKQHNHFPAEIYGMTVHPGACRGGIERALVHYRRYSGKHQPVDQAHA